MHIARNRLATQTSIFLVSTLLNATFRTVVHHLAITVQRLKPRINNVFSCQEASRSASATRELPGSNTVAEGNAISDSTIKTFRRYFQKSRFRTTSDLCLAIPLQEYRVYTR